jgi:hypothetical protein
MKRLSEASQMAFGYLDTQNDFRGHHGHPRAITATSRP